MKVALSKALTTATRSFLSGMLVRDIALATNPDGSVQGVSGVWVNGEHWNAGEQDIEINANGHAVFAVRVGGSPEPQLVNATFYCDRPIAEEDFQEEDVVEGEFITCYG